MRPFARVAILLLPLAAGACADSAGPLDQLRRPASLAIAEELVIDDGDTVEVPVTVYDQRGRAYASIPSGSIEWSSDDASIAEVDDAGRLSGEKPGTTTLRARLGELEAQSAVAVRAFAREVVVVTPPAGNLLPSAPTPDSIAVRVIDRHGAGVANVAVEFTVTAGGGSVSPGGALTDANGVARVEWTLGPSVGTHALLASAAGLSETLTIEATITQVVLGGFVAPASVAQGASLPVSVRVNTSVFPAAVGAAHVVVTWDPAVLALAGDVGSGDYARTQVRLDAAAGKLHLFGIDAAATQGDLSVAELTFEVVGGGGVTTISLDALQLVDRGFRDVTSALVAQDVVIDVVAGGAP